MAAAGPLCDESKERSSIDNPIMIDDDKRSDKQSISKQDNSDGDTEPLSTPVFWGCLGDGGLHVPPDNSESPLTDSTSGLAPSKSTHDQRLDCIHSPSLGPTTCSLAKEERSGAVEIAKGGEGASQTKDESFYWTAEVPPSCNQLYFSRFGQGDGSETSIETSQPDNDHPARQQGSSKRKRVHKGEDDSGNRRSKRLANNAKT